MPEYTSTLSNDLSFKTSLCQCSTSTAAAETRTFFCTELKGMLLIHFKHYLAHFRITEEAVEL